MVDPWDTMTRLGARAAARPPGLASGAPGSALWLGAAEEVAKRRPGLRRYSEGQARGLEAAAPGTRQHRGRPEMARARNASPRRRASRRPSSVRLRCVLQSSSRMPAGSPTPGVVMAWRIRMTWPPPLSRAQSCSLAAAGPGKASSSASAQPSQVPSTCRGRRRRWPDHVLADAATDEVPHRRAAAFTFRPRRPDPGAGARAKVVASSGAGVGIASGEWSR